MIIKSAKALIATIGLSMGYAAISEDLVYYATDPNETDDGQTQPASSLLKSSRDGYGYAAPC